MTIDVVPSTSQVSLLDSHGHTLIAMVSEYLCHHVVNADMPYRRRSLRSLAMA